MGLCNPRGTPKCRRLLPCKLGAQILVAAAPLGKARAKKVWRSLLWGAQVPWDSERMQTLPRGTGPRPRGLLRLEVGNLPSELWDQGGDGLGSHLQKNQPVRTLSTQPHVTVNSRGPTQIFTSAALLRLYHVLREDKEAPAPAPANMSEIKFLPTWWVRQSKVCFI